LSVAGPPGHTNILRRVPAVKLQMPGQPALTPLLSSCPFCLPKGMARRATS
jgi:hypothetical protein